MRPRLHRARAVVWAWLVASVMVSACSAGPSASDKTGAEKSADAGKSSEARAPSPGDSAPPPKQQTKERAPFPGDEDVYPEFALEWFTGSFAAARAAAQEQGRLLLLDFGADWCTACHELDKRVLTRPAVGAYLSKQFIVVHVDADKREGPELVRRYRVSSFPTLLVLTPGGLELGRATEVMRHDTPEADAEALLEELSRIAAPETARAHREQLFGPEPATLHLRRLRAEALALLGERAAAEREYARVLDGDADGRDGLAPEVLFDRAELIFERLAQDPARALAELDTLEKRFPESRAARRARDVRARLLHALGRVDEALALYAAPVDGALPDRHAVANAWFCLDHDVARASALTRVRAARERVKPAARGELWSAEVALAEALGRDEEALAGLRALSELEPGSLHHHAHARRLLRRAKLEGTSHE